MDEVKQYLVQEFLDEYRAKRMVRRAMLRRITLILGGAAAAATWLQSQGESVSAREAEIATRTLIPPPPAAPQMVSPDDPSIVASAVQFAARDGADLIGYISRPATASMGTPAPGVLVIHENRGLTDQQRDVTRRFAKEGFVAVAVDLTSREGGAGSFPDGAAIGAALTAAGSDRHVGDLMSSVDYLLAQPETSQLGAAVTGYCFGGSLSWRMAVMDDRLAAAAPYYGSAPPLDLVPGMRAASLGVYAETDDNVNRTRPGLEDALTSAGKTFQMKTYPGTMHAFFNDTGERYNATAAADAWTDTLAWFRQHTA